MPLISSVSESKLENMTFIYYEFCIAFQSISSTLGVRVKVE